MKEEIIDVTPKKVTKELKLWALILIIFATAFIFIYSSYAWFRATLRVEIDNLDIHADSDNDMLISLDGKSWDSTVSINKKTIITDLKKVYPNHVNQWAEEGLYTVSSNGLANLYTNKFLIFKNEDQTYKYSDVNVNDTTMNIIPISETKEKTDSFYIAFDLFIKNSTPSPFGDYLYISNDTVVEGTKEKHTQITDSMRIGISFADFTDYDAPLEKIQNLGCNPACNYIIYEPNYLSHTQGAITEAFEHNITIVDGKYYPTYAVIASNENLNIYSGVVGSGKPLDTKHFALQDTIHDDTVPITILRRGIVKSRIYIWVEGQDVDDIEHINFNEPANISITFRKEMIK